MKAYLLCALLGLALAGRAFAQNGGGDGSVSAASFKQAIGDDDWQKLQARLASLNGDISTRGIVSYPGAPDKLLTGYAYGQFYDWDLYFENIYLSYYGISDYCFANFKVFLSTQKPDGFIARSFGPHPWGADQMFKPFLAQIAVLGSKQKGNDYEWLRASSYDGLKKYIDRWFDYDSDHNGLPVWDSADASGMDNQVIRAGGMHAFLDEGVDLACYLYREEQAMAIIAGKLGKPDDQKMYLARADALAKKINEVFWDDKDGFYYDRNEKTGTTIRVKTVVGFLPLWAGIASPGQASRLVKEHLLNPKEFWLKYPITTLAASEPGFYQGSRRGECNWCGTTWIPTNYMVFHGLVRYGFKDVARDLAYKTFHMALDENPVTREFYDSDTGHGNGMNPFWGWSSLAYAMPLEFETGYDPTDLNGEIKPLISTALNLPGPKH